jgi:SAM-dependent methyltransferase
MPNCSNQTQCGSCPVCGASIQFWRLKQVENLCYRLDLCSICGYCFVNPRPSLEFLMRYYSTSGYRPIDTLGETLSVQNVMEGERLYPNSTLDAKSMLKTIQTLSRPTTSKRFLDVGCGYGFFSKEAIGAGFDVRALELARNERNIAQQLTELTPIASSFEDYQCEPDSLGVILMSQILEHAIDVNLWIQKAHQMLEKNGLLAIAVPNYGSLFRKVLQESDPFICPPVHLNFFNPRSLSLLLKKHGFEVMRTEWISRLPQSAFEKRLPSFTKPLLPLVQLGSNFFLACIDQLRMGMIIRLYSRKII